MLWLNGGRAPELAWGSPGKISEDVEAVMGGSE